MTAVLARRGGDLRAAAALLWHETGAFVPAAEKTGAKLRTDASRVVASEPMGLSERWGLGLALGQSITARSSCATAAGMRIANQSGWLRGLEHTSSTCIARRSISQEVQHAARHHSFLASIDQQCKGASPLRNDSPAPWMLSTTPTSVHGAVEGGGGGGALLLPRRRRRRRRRQLLLLRRRRRLLLLQRWRRLRLLRRLC
jgi:hypothetical protein